MKSRTVPSAASGRVNHVENRGRRYEPKSRRQMRAFLYPAGGAGSKLPNRIDHPHVDVESTQNVELVVRNREGPGQNRSHSPGPGSIDRDDGIRNGVVTEDPISRSGCLGRRAAHAIDVVRPVNIEHGTSHVADLIVRISG